jgi:hypothetical protein
MQSKRVFDKNYYITFTVVKKLKNLSTFVIYKKTTKSKHSPNLVTLCGDSEENQQNWQVL